MTETYLDPDETTEARLEDLLDRMTLEEKAGQLSGTYLSFVDEIIRVNDVKKEIREHKIGSVSPFGVASSPYNTPKKAAKIGNKLQEYAMKKTRLGIPLIYRVDAVHGHGFVKGATVFPHNLGLAATFDTEAAERVGEITAEEVGATGGHQNYGPVCDVARDVRWGRTYETFGESPYLCSQMARAKVEAMGEDMVSTPKHFPAYSQPERGEDGAPVDVSLSTLREIFLPPFEAAFEAGARSVMACYNSIDREPVHSSERFLTDLLRDELGFQGFAVSDWWGVKFLHEEHKTSSSTKEAVYNSLDAGLDVASIGRGEYVELIVELVEEGKLPESRVDEAAGRFLRAKFELGLFEDPYVEPSKVDEKVGTQEHRNGSLEVARKSITLLKNDVLPFSPSADRILVTGPNSDNLLHQLGGWSPIGGFGVSDLREAVSDFSVSDFSLSDIFSSSDSTPDISVRDLVKFRPGPHDSGVTVLEGIEDVVSAQTDIVHEKGCDLSSYRDEGFTEIKREARRSNGAVVVLGENWYVHEFGPSVMAGDTSEFPKRTSLELPKPQRELVEAMSETGVPTAVVLISGRPLILDEIAEKADAVAMAYFPGGQGGQAVGEVLFGETNPSGKLPISFPKSEGHLPTRFNHFPHPRPIGDDEHEESYDPVFGFGHGLSYTEFEYNFLDIQDSESIIEAEVEVSNVGERKGEEVVLVYLNEKGPKVTPVRELRAFERQSLRPGETSRTTFELEVRDESREAEVIVGDWELSERVSLR